MGSFSMMHWVIVGLVVLVLFGRGKISETMGDFGKGISSFRKGMSEEDKPVQTAPPAQIAQGTNANASVPVSDSTGTKA